jgi:UDP-N-acetylglucosamine enolpyruvyl transferase
MDKNIQYVWVLDKHLSIGYNGYMTITIESKEVLIDKVKAYLLQDFLKSLEATDLDQDEKDANIVLSRKKMQLDSENIATLLYKVYGLE